MWKARGLAADSKDDKGDKMGDFEHTLESIKWVGSSVVSCSNGEVWSWSS